MNTLATGLPVIVAGSTRTTAAGVRAVPQLLAVDEYFDKTLASVRAAPATRTQRLVAATDAGGGRRGEYEALGRRCFRPAPRVSNRKRAPSHARSG